MLLIFILVLTIYNTRTVFSIQAEQLKINNLVTRDSVKITESKSLERALTL